MGRYLATHPQAEGKFLNIILEVNVGKRLFQFGLTFLFISSFCTGCLPSDSKNQVTLEASKPNLTASVYPPTESLVIPSPTATANQTQENKPTQQNEVPAFQVPVEISGLGESSSDILYKDVQVVLPITSDPESTIYVNFDNLMDNSALNSDLAFVKDSKKDFDFYHVIPINSAMLYQPGGYEVDLGMCKQNIKEFELDPVPHFYSIIPFCVLTNENRIAIIEYIPGLWTYDSDGKQISFAIKVSVYQEKVTVPPTSTPIPVDPLDTRPTSITRITGTQMPVDILSDSGQTDELLYENVKVKLTVDIRNGEAMAYLNLDDLQNNSQTNSDFIFLVTQGTIPGYFFFPTNYAKIFEPPTNKPSFATCSKDLSLYQDFPAIGLLTGYPYCVLTNENRIAIINLVLNSLERNEESQIASVVINVTVYQKIQK